MLLPLPIFNTEFLRSYEGSSWDWSGVGSGASPLESELETIITLEHVVAGSASDLAVQFELPDRSAWRVFDSISRIPLVNATIPVTSYWKGQFEHYLGYNEWPLPCDSQSYFVCEVLDTGFTGSTFDGDFEAVTTRFKSFALVNDDDFGFYPTPTDSDEFDHYSLEVYAPADVTVSWTEVFIVISGAGTYQTHTVGPASISDDYDDFDLYFDSAFTAHMDDFDFRLRFSNFQVDDFDGVVIQLRSPTGVTVRVIDGFTGSYDRQSITFADVGMSLRHGQLIDADGRQASLYRPTAGSNIGLDSNRDWDAYLPVYNEMFSLDGMARIYAHFNGESAVPASGRVTLSISNFDMPPHF